MNRERIHRTVLVQHTCATSRQPVVTVSVIETAVGEPTPVVTDGLDRQQELAKSNAQESAQGIECEACRLLAIKEADKEANREKKRKDAEKAAEQNRHGQRPQYPPGHMPLGLRTRPIWPQDFVPKSWIPVYQTMPPREETEAALMPRKPLVSPVEPGSYPRRRPEERTLLPKNMQPPYLVEPGSYLHRRPGEPIEESGVDEEYGSTETEAGPPSCKRRRSNGTLE